MDITIDRTLHISFPDAQNEALHDITTQIEESSVSLSEVLFSDNNILFGSYNSTKFEITLYDIPDVSSQRIEVYFTDINLNRIDVFSGFVDSSKLDNLGYYRQIVAYDELYWKKNVNASIWWDSFWTTHTSSVSLKTLRDSLCTYAGFDYDDSKSLFNDNLTIKPKNIGIQNISVSEILTYICELQCTFPHITRIGQLEFIDLTKVNTHDIRNKYEQISSEFEDYTTDQITQVVVTINNEEIYRTHSVSTNVYTLNDNLFLYDFTNDEIESVAENYLDYIETIQYIPASITMICSDLDIQLGDILITDKGYTRAFNNDLFGMLLVEQTLSATGDRRYGEVTSSANLAYADLASRVANTAETLKRDYITADVIDANYTRTDALDADVAHLGYLKTENLDAENTNLGYAKVGELEAEFATIDLANVNNAWIENGIIKNAAISNEMVISVSANKLTAGTIDASNIKVTNLDATEIKTGKLVVDGITIDVEANEAFIDGAYIEDETITLNGLSKDVVDEINASVQTWTTDEIPLLVNYPASDWTTVYERDKHIGDICYVVNPVISENGYCYRFTKDSQNNYYWILIKDKDIIDALQQLVDANGNIAGLKSFEANTHFWITDTNEELSSLKSRTTTLETDIGSKVNTSTFNEIKQTVDSNLSTITALSESKASNSDLTALTNRVSDIEQTASEISLSVSKLFSASLDTESDLLSNNILRNASTMPINAYGCWADGTWQAREAVVTTETVTESTPIARMNTVLRIRQPVTAKANVAVTGLSVTGSTGDNVPCVWQKNYTISSDKVGLKLVLSGWFKGTAGDSFTLTAITGQSQIYTLITNEWEFKYFVTDEITVASTIDAIGKISLDSVANSLYVCAFKLEYGSYPSSWSILTDEVTYQSAQLDIHTNSISALVTEVFPNGVQSKSSIEQNADNIALKVSQTDYNGAQITSLINQSASTVQIDAEHINLNGVVTANNYFEVNTDGSFSANKGMIGDLTVEDGSLTTFNTNSYTYTETDVNMVYNIIHRTIPGYNPSERIYALYDAPGFGHISSGSYNYVRNMVDQEITLHSELTINPHDLVSMIKITNKGVPDGYSNDGVSIGANVISTPNLFINKAHVEDFIVDEGYENGWHYIKLNEGTAIAYTITPYNLGSINTNISYGNGYYTDIVNLYFPSGLFIEPPSVIAQVHASNGLLTTNVYFANTTVYSLHVGNMRNEIVNNAKLSSYVVGRWRFGWVDPDIRPGIDTPVN